MPPAHLERAAYLVRGGSLRWISLVERQPMADDDPFAMPPPACRRAHRRSSRLLLAAVAVALAAVNLRPVATAVGPVLLELREDLGMGGGAAGVLTGLPGLMFGAAGILTVAVARRLGVAGAMTLGLVLLTAGSALRALTGSVAALLALTVLALLGAGLGNILIPAFIKTHFAHRQAGMTAVYTAGLAVGATAAALVAAPIAQATSAGWRASLGIWAVSALVSVLPWVLLTVLERRREPLEQVTGPGTSRVTGSRHAVALAVFFGLQSSQAYVQFGWLAQMFRDAGGSATLGGALASLVAVLGLPAGLAMPHLVQRLRDLRPVMVGFGVLLVVGYAGILWAPLSLPWLWALCLGASGAAFPTAIALITARTRSPQVAARVSGFTQGFGYLLAAIAPLGIGLVHDATGGWEVPLIILMGSGPLLALAGVIAGQQVVIDDELVAAGTP